MKIAITGAHGFIGTRITSFLHEKGHEVVPMHTSDFQIEKVSVIRSKLHGCDAVINLAGANIGKRWSTRYKQLIYDSRVQTTRLLVSAINSMVHKPAVLVSASAVGFYPSGKTYTEESTIGGKDFLAKVCTDWENEARKTDHTVRLVISRFGMVLAPTGGAFPKMLIPFRIGIGGKIGEGKQHFSWIHIDDLLEAMLFVIHNGQVSGETNFVAPESPKNVEFAKKTARLLHVPCCVRVPKFFFRIMLGEGHIFVTGDKSAYPKKLIDNGFRFRFPDIQSALEDLLKDRRTLSRSHSPNEDNLSSIPVPEKLA